MPTYGYKCDECGIYFERFQHFSEDPIKTCPECGGDVHRVIHPVGIVFKGSGFYVTDNRGNSSTAIPGKKAETPSTTSETPAKAPEAQKSTAKD